MFVFDSLQVTKHAITHSMPLGLTPQTPPTDSAAMQVFFHAKPARAWPWRRNRVMWGCPDPLDA